MQTFTDVTQPGLFLPTECYASIAIGLFVVCVCTSPVYYTRVQLCVQHDGVHSTGPSGSAETVLMAVLTVHLEWSIYY